MKNTFLRCCTFVTVVCAHAFFLCGFASAEVRLPSVFADHMVVQQQMKIRIWGWAEQGESVEVALGENRAKAVPSEAGRWQVELPAMNASHQPLILTVKGNNTVTIEDVLVGEVWLCSGQSNMEWTVSRSADAANEISSAKFPLIRHFKVAHNHKNTPQDDVSGSWEICSPETVGDFTACGYFMARRLHQELDVPIGLVNSSWGGTRVEPWTSPGGFEKVEALQDIYRSVMGRTPGESAYQDRLADYVASMEDWMSKAKSSMHSQERVSASPTYPAELAPFTSHQDPTMLFNGMINPLVGFSIRGAVWYQGESNHNEGMLYFEKKKALINGWRSLWGQGDFPFYYVQIAPYQYGKEDPTILPTFWEAQAAVQEIPKTGMVVINDIATIGNIHPPAKQKVGQRLAQLALTNEYGRSDLVANSPGFSSLELQGDRLSVSFKNTGGGLKTRDGKSPTHFEIIGPGSAGFQDAEATIDGDTVVLRSEKVEAPVAFRFAWHKLAEPNLTGGTGLPVGAGRGGAVPSFLSTLPIDGDYTLVYDLDLSKLGGQISYDVDESDSIRSFDRIGYLMELTAAGGEEQKVFVSMNAFTEDAKKIAIPTFSAQARFQQTVESMDVYSTSDDITTGTNIASGNIEFWASNYSPGNSSAVKGASSGVYDFGDEPGPSANGYGSMQVHNFAAKQTVFAINHWSQGPGADIGVGNSQGKTKDWTFTANAKTYSSKRLRVYVKQK